MKAITEKTLIPLSLVVVIISSTIAVTIAVQDSKAQGFRIDKVESTQERFERESMQERRYLMDELATIKADLRYIKQKVK